MTIEMIDEEIFNQGNHYLFGYIQFCNLQNWVLF